MPRTTEELLTDADKIASHAAVLSHTGYYLEDDYDNAIKLISELSAKLRECEWQDISTAPKDGTRIIVVCKFSVDIIYYGSSGSMNGKHWFIVDNDGGMQWTSDEYPATKNPSYLKKHSARWQPLPTPPKKED